MMNYLKYIFLVGSWLTFYYSNIFTSSKREDTIQSQQTTIQALKDSLNLYQATIDSLNQEIANLKKDSIPKKEYNDLIDLFSAAKKNYEKDREQWEAEKSSLLQRITHLEDIIHTPKQQQQILQQYRKQKDYLLKTIELLKSHLQNINEQLQECIEEKRNLKREVNTLKDTIFTQ